MKAVAPGRLCQVEQPGAVHPGYGAIVGDAGLGVSAQPDGGTVPQQVGHGRGVVNCESLRHEASCAGG